MPLEEWARTELAARGDRVEDHLRTEAGAEVFRGRHLVLKVHRTGTDPAALAARLAAAARVPLLLAPLLPTAAAPDGRPVTWWPRVEVLDPGSARQPWAECGVLLARLHRSPVPDGLPVLDPWARLDRALDRALDTASALAEAMLVRELAAGLPRAGRPAAETTLVHGDWHLGQVGRHAGHRLLLDVDDLAVGDPAWDLARPAGFRAAGLLGDEDWRAFLDGYRGAGGPAVPAGGDPWPGVDLPARVAVLTATANALARGDDVADDLLQACRGMSRSSA